MSGHTCRGHCHRSSAMCARFWTQGQCRLFGERAAYRAVARKWKSRRKSGAHRTHVKLLLSGGASMTTEIAVLNRLGVALATDSAVTVSNSETSKVFNSADKLFELTCEYPVGVMINGNMDCVGIPREILIKDFRGVEGNKPRNSVTEWADELLAFAQSIVTSSAESQDHFLTRTALIEIEYSKNEILRQLWPEMTPAGARKLINGICQQRTDDLRLVGISDAHKDMDLHALASKKRQLLSRLIIEGFDPITLDQSDIDAIIIQIITASVAMSSDDLLTGVIVAGYGSDDRYPSVSSFEVAGLAFGKLKCSKTKPRAVVSADKRGHAVSFAQNDVIERLLGGADPRFTDKVAEFISQLLETVSGTLSSIGTKKRLSKEERTRRADTI